MWTYTVEPHVPLLGDIDAEDRFSRIPARYTIKGMFCSSLAKALGRELQELRPGLEAPPRAGRYLPFNDYPQVDYCRLAYRASRLKFPSEPAPEAARLLARADFATFARSHLGKVITTFIKSPEDMLLSLPKTTRKVLKGGTVSAARVADNGVRLGYLDYHGWVDCYTIGTVEGIVMHFGYTPHIEVSLESEVDAVYVVRWT